MFFANEVRLQLLQRYDGVPALITQRVHLLVVLELGTGRGDERMNIDHTLEVQQVQQGFLAVAGRCTAAGGRSGFCGLDLLLADRRAPVAIEKPGCPASF
jgi:hypothetical protein